MDTSGLAGLVGLSVAVGVALAQAPSGTALDGRPQASEVIDADGPYDWNSGENRIVFAPVLKRPRASN